MLKSIKLFQSVLHGSKKLTVETKKILSDNQKLSAVVKKISCVKSYEHLIPAILENFLEFCGAKKGSLMILDDGGVLTIRAAAGLSASAWKVVKLKSDEGVAGEAIELAKPVFIKDISQTQKYKKFFHSRPVRSESLLVVPLIFRGEKLGVVNLHGLKDYNKEAVSVLADFVSQSLKNTLLEKTVVTDQMTGLYNQNYFKKRLAQELKIAKKYKLDLSLLLFDIDFFKKFNDTYGHLAGDFVIIEIAKILKKTLRFSDVKSRYGGEEFGVIMTSTCVKDAFDVAERLRKKIENTAFHYKDSPLKVTISAGISHSQNDSNALNLIQRADEALYKSKQLGRNRVTIFEK